MISTGWILFMNRASFLSVEVSVDIFSFSHELPYRVEFFGDFIESIRTFEIESQLSVEQVKSITIVPNVQLKVLNGKQYILVGIC